MSVEIRYQVGHKPSDGEVCRMLNAQYPNKVFTMGPGKTIVESYRDQPVTFELPAGQRATDAMAARAVASELDRVPSYLERTMTNEL